MIKRLIDLVFSAFGLAVFSPLFFLIGVSIAVFSPGPIFFRQVRVGLRGRRFKIFKFRTMIHNLENPSPVTRHNDSRITKVGRILRMTKLDELPQLLNVLFGDMSLVGPRPEIPELVAFYTIEQKKLLEVKPGITSPATIYHRDEEEIVGTYSEIIDYHKNVLIPKKASFDLAYVENASFLYDLKIIILTLISVFTNQSGYMRDQALKQRRIFIFLIHIFISASSYYLSFIARFDATIPSHEFSRFLKTLTPAVLTEIIILQLFGLSHGYWRYVGIKDVVTLGQAVFLSTIAMLFADFFFLDPAYPTGVIFIDGIISFILLSLLRFSSRFLREAYYPIIPKSSEKILILGASDKGEAILRDIQRDPDLGYEIIGFLDLEPSKRGIRIHGFKVLGTLDSLDGILREREISTIINTYETLSRENTIKLSKITAPFKIKIKTLPSISDVLSSKVNINKLRELRYEDLLGRDEVRLDKELLEQIYRDKIVLITGAGGSIGSELVRQILLFSPKQLILFDKDESLLYEISTEIYENNAKAPIKTIIGDIRDIRKLELVFKAYKPAITLHAAAYKHVPLLEEHPQEAVSNNVYGTRNLLEISAEYGVERFVMISTDKAVRPTNVMGATKRLSERYMFECIAPASTMKCMAVRFGNVLGSRGSVIPVFRRQIEKGGPVVITHKDITRYFMSIPEAAQLVLQAGAMGKGSEIFILKMGEPVKIKDLAYRMIEHSGLIPEIDIPIHYCGLRPGEKMFEELFTVIENSRATEHEKIFISDHQYENALEKEIVEMFEKDLLTRTNREIRDFLACHIPDYTPKNTIG